MDYVTHHCLFLLSTGGLSYRFIVFLASRATLRHLSHLFFCTHGALNLTNSINAHPCQITRGFWHVDLARDVIGLRNVIVYFTNTENILSMKTVSA